MRRAAWIGAALVWLMSPALAGTPAPTGALQDCENSRIKPTEQISACTQILIGGATNLSLADIYSFRGAAYLRNGDLDSAVHDFSDAINRNRYDDSREVRHCAGRSFHASVQA